MNSRIMFLRDSNYRPVGCVAISINRRDRVLNYQYSVLNPNDQFDRKMARHLALGRLVEAPVKVQYARGTSINMHLISEMVMLDIANSEAPSRAVKAARLWLRDQGL